MEAAPRFAAVVGIFARVGLLAFGGGVSSHLLNQFTRRGWLTPGGFLDAMSWCQNLPGPNATNLAAFLGWRFAGIPGALASTFALVAPGADTPREQDVAADDPQSDPPEPAAADRPAESGAGSTRLGAMMKEDVR